ncbi:MAG TPA: hypothetical protein VJ022_11355 [Anaerolineales bacterium]|nr:hypothetical protein [Anaerolineales bacterium]
MNQPKTASPSPTQPRNGHGNGHKVSQRGLFSIITFLVTTTLLTAAFLGGARLVIDVLNEGLENAFEGIWYKVIVVGIAYLLGWIVALVSIRVYSNLILPIVINLYAWGCLIAVCAMYLVVLQRLYMQKYDMVHYWAYLTIMVGGLGAMVGLHLIIEGHELRPFSIPLLIVNLVQFCLIVYRYVFTLDPNPDYLWIDLFFYIVMLVFAILMLAHIGALEPLRNTLTRFFDRNSKVIRTED